MLLGSNVFPSFVISVGNGASALFIVAAEKKKHMRIDARICRITTPQNARAPPPPDNGATLRHAHRLKCVSAMLAPWKMVVGRRIFEREGRGQLTAVATLENRLEVKRSNPNILTNSLYIVRLKEYQSISVENFVTGESVKAAIYSIGGVKSFDL